jgi:hypothetical protein
MLAVQAFCLVQCWKPIVHYHTHIYGPVHGVTTHENSTTISLYGYDLAEYVVESSLGIPTGCAEAAMAEPLGCSVKLRWLNRGVVWVQL